MISLDKLAGFIVRAKKAGYASKGEGQETVTSDGAKVLTYEEGELTYVDEYRGFNPFWGTETVSRDGKPIWVMHFRGEASGANRLEAKRIYHFLKEALSQVAEERPFRGPKRLKRKEFEYIDRLHRRTIDFSDGEEPQEVLREVDLSDFSGEEFIFLDGKKVYHLSYEGGFVEQNESE